MVRRDGVVKILDLGLVKLLTDADPRLTMTGEGIGNILGSARSSWLREVGRILVRAPRDT
jgi:hypothetical protein